MSRTVTKPKQFVYYEAHDLTFYAQILGDFNKTTQNSCVGFKKGVCFCALRSPVCPRGRAGLGTIQGWGLLGPTGRKSAPGIRGSAPPLLEFYPPTANVARCPAISDFRESRNRSPPTGILFVFLMAVVSFRGCQRGESSPPYWNPPPLLLTSPAARRFWILGNPEIPPPLLGSTPLEDPTPV